MGKAREVFFCFYPRGEREAVGGGGSGLWVRGRRKEGVKCGNCSGGQREGDREGRREGGRRIFCCSPYSRVGRRGGVGGGAGTKNVKIHQKQIIDPLLLPHIASQKLLLLH